MSTTHAFKIGQTVRISTPTIHPRGSDICKIVALMPEERGDFHYRVESVSGGQVRMVLESQITSLDTAAL